MKQSRRHNPLLTHQPFAGLKHRAHINAGLKGPSRPQAMKTSEQHETEKEAEGIFLRAVKDVRPLSKDSIEKAPSKQPLFNDVPDNRDEELFLQAVQRIGRKTFDSPARDEEDSDTRQRSLSSRLRQLKKGSIKINGELDLHGYFREEAILRLEQFIASSFIKDRQAVLVITGKGINSPEGPVLRTAVSDWLSNQGRAMVAEFHPAPPNMGGRGAFVVFLRPRK